MQQFRARRFTSRQKLDTGKIDECHLFQVQYDHSCTAFDLIGQRLAM